MPDTDLGTITDTDYLVSKRRTKSSAFRVRSTPRKLLKLRHFGVCKTTSRPTRRPMKADVNQNLAAMRQNLSSRGLCLEASLTGTLFIPSARLLPIRAAHPRLHLYSALRTRRLYHPSTLCAIQGHCRGPSRAVRCDGVDRIGLGSRGEQQKPLFPASPLPNSRRECLHARRDRRDHR